ncbi:hypothetical protein [Aureimonas mangrovi]|uniref:hypothetical protein n=1 Tax=Aureimonas mangrovi TaxID=2758041 RepID=UPI00163D4A3B|nr:hypothetical protein [Aureimonas mangrovi]
METYQLVGHLREMRNAYAQDTHGQRSGSAPSGEHDLQTLIDNMAIELSAAVEMSASAKGGPLSLEMADTLEDFANVVYDHVEAIRQDQLRRRD